MRLQLIPLSADEERIVEQLFEPHQIEPTDYFLYAGEVVIIAGITAAHRAKIVAEQTWQSLISLTVLTALIALWRTG